MPGTLTGGQASRLLAGVVLAVLSATAPPATAQSPTAAGRTDTVTATPAEREAVLAVIDTFFRALAANDSATMLAMRTEGAQDVIELPDGKGGTRIVRRAPAAMKPGTYLERYWDPVVHVRGGLAVVWTPYEFWRDGVTTHCGIDVFELVREGGTWRIGTILYTVEPDACEALRPADPSRMRPAP